MELTDTHCHLTLSPLIDHLDEVLSRARNQSVTRIIVPSYDLASWELVAGVSRREGLFAAYGIHPWVADQPFDAAVLKNILTRENAKAVGEIGLDFKTEISRQKQIDALVAQLQCAVELELPVSLHVRGAFEEMLEILHDMNPRPRGVVHAFSKGPELMKRFIDLGFHIAFGGAVTRGNAKKVRAAAAAIPIDRMLLETDAPSIGLEGVEPRDVEPAHIADIAAVVAEIRGESIEHIASATTANAAMLFGLG
jgi:TatD DNase family protein